MGINALEFSLNNWKDRKNKEVSRNSRENTNVFLYH